MQSADSIDREDFSQSCRSVGIGRSSEGEATPSISIITDEKMHLYFGEDAVQHMVQDSRENDHINLLIFEFKLSKNTYVLSTHTVSSSHHSSMR